MGEIARTKDEIYKAVSWFYRNKGLDKDIFIKRLKMVRSLIDGNETMNDAVGWVFATEVIEHCTGSTDAEIRSVKKVIREEVKDILSLLNIKALHNQLIDERGWRG